MKKIFLFIQKTLKLIAKNDRKKLLIAIPVSVFLSLLDLLGVILLGTVGTFAYKSVSGDTKPTRIELLVKSTFDGNIDQTKLMVVVAIIAVSVLIIKTLSQLYFNYKLSRFLARQESQLSINLFDKILNGNSHQVLSTNVSEYQYALITGSARLTSSVLGGVISVVTDGVNIFILGFFAFLISPGAFLGAIFIFLLVYSLTSKFVKNKAEEYGIKNQAYSMQVHRSVIESARGFKELKVYNKKIETLSDFGLARSELSLINQRTAWLSNLLRYIFEISVLVSAVACAGVLIYTTDARRTISVVVVFLAMGFRLIPSVQRVQNSFIGFRVIMGASQQVFDLYEKFGNNLEKSDKQSVKENSYRLDSVELSNVSLANPTNPDQFILHDINLSLRVGQVFALIGQSGSGKTSLADLIVGLNEPTSGFISYVGNGEALNINSILKGYVNQNPAMYSDSLFENIAYGVENKIVDIPKIKKILKDLNLDYFISENEIGEIVPREINMDSTNISGGERQRIAIARALYADSKIIILDEPSSALDKKSQNLLIEAIMKIKNDRVIVVITHSDRLMLACDFVIELSQGTVINQYEIKK
jgi:ABC-type multidrug transport system fused ATPase/permease subunit